MNKIKIFSLLEMMIWYFKGKPSPPPHTYKNKLISYYAKKNKINVFIETGTYQGAMIDKVLFLFEKIFSIEIDKNLYNKAKKKFKSNSKVKLINGDSSMELEKVLNQLDDKVLIWLDGHYSGIGTGKGETDCPTEKELMQIRKYKKPIVILIDDIRCFTGENGYPTKDFLLDFCKSNEYSYLFHVDILAIWKN